MKRIEDFLAGHAIALKDKTAVVCNGNRYSYAELFDRVQREAERLSKEHGRAVVFRSSQTIDFLVTYMAIHEMGGVAVPLPHDMPEAAFNAIRAQVEKAEIPDNVADILFTTGTTGRQKGVMISHRAILANAENLVDSQKYSSDLTFIICGPLNHIGSLSKIYPTMMVGGTLCILEGMKDINQFYHAVNDASSKTATFLVPATIRILLNLSEEKLASFADKLDFIETGAAPIAQSDMKKLCHALPHSRLYNTYASTETGIISTYNFNDGSCLQGCLGKPMKHSSIAISPSGHIVCQGKTLMSGYVGDPALTAEVISEDGLHTQDLGFIDTEGMLHIQGRTDDVINIGGFKVAPTEVEDAALSIEGIKDCICISTNHPILGNTLKLIIVESKPGTLNKREVAKALQKKLENHKIPLLYEFTDSIKRTFNGKLDRKAYRP